MLRPQCVRSMTAACHLCEKYYSTDRSLLLLFAEGASLESVDSGSLLDTSDASKTIRAEHHRQATKPYH